MQLRFIVTLWVSIILISACNKDNAADTTSILPLISPLVAKATPSGASRDYGSRTSAEAAEALKDFFTDTFGNISGGTETGWVKAYLKDLDGRIEEINSSSEPSCLAETAVDTTFSVGAGNHALTVKLNCAKSFHSSREESGVGSGIAFGEDDTYTYIYLLLIQSNGTDKFGYVAKVNKSTEAVELLFLEAFPSFNRVKFAHLRTNPSTKGYEFSAAGTGDGVGPSSTNTVHMLFAGARFIANETEIRAEGNVAANTTATGAASPAAFAFSNTDCFDSTNLAAAVATCTSSAPSFASDMELVAATTLNGNTTISSSLKTIEALITSGVTEYSPSSEEN